MVHFADANGILQTLHLSEDLRQVLQTFVVSLSLLIGDDVKVSREGQVMQSAYLTVGKGDLVRPGSDNDVVTFSLLLHHLVKQFIF
jgi:mediator of RNA polymerase II transcription subunit 5